MKFKYIVNGKECEMEVGEHLEFIEFSYEEIVESANKNPENNPTVTFKKSDSDGTLGDGMGILIHFDDKPIFNVADTSST